MTDAGDELFLKYLEGLQAGRQPDTSKPPFDNPEFHAELRKWERVQNLIKKIPLDDMSAPPTIPGIKILQELGRGGMGRVYLAEDTSLKRLVAVKIIPKFNNEAVIRRFKQESMTLAKFNHPHIVIIHNHGDTAEHYYFVMQYLEGVALNRIVQLLKENRFSKASDVFRYVRGEIPLPPAKDGQVPNETGMAPQFIRPPASRVETTLDAEYFRCVAGIVKQACDALARAHEADVIHRDVKPHNIIYDIYGQAKVMDFGISKVPEVSMRTMTTEQVGGTLYYRSPEMAQGRHVTKSTDIFSLGIVLYELLCLKRPFDGETTDEVNRAVIEKDPPDVCSVRKEAPSELSAVAARCLEKDPAKRYPDMRAVKQDIGAYLGEDTKYRDARRSHASSPKWILAAVVLIGAAAWAMVSVLHKRKDNSTATSVPPVVVVPQINDMFPLSPLGERAGVRGTITTAIDTAALIHADPAIDVKVWTDKHEYKSGDRLRVHVQSNRDGFLRLYCLQSDNTIFRLSTESAEHIGGERSYTFPTKSPGYEVTPDPPGEQTILAVMSSVPFNKVSPKDDTALAQTALARLPLQAVATEQFRGIRNPQSSASYNSAFVNILTAK